MTCVVFLPRSCTFEPEGNACSLTDSTAEEHVLALVEHAADEARDRISRLLPGGKVESGVSGQSSCPAGSLWVPSPAPSLGWAGASKGALRAGASQKRCVMRGRCSRLAP